MNKLITTTLLILLTIPAFSHTGDSLEIINLQTKIENLEGFQDNTKDSLGNKFDKLSNELEREKNLFWIVSGILALLGLAGIASVIAKYRKIEKQVEDKLNKKFDNIITEKEGDILALIDKQSKEKQFVKNKIILVLTAKDGDDSFLRTFFKAMGFPINNVKFIKVDKHLLIPNYDPDLIFANNEKGDLSSFDEEDKLNLIDEFFEKSSPETVLFYFNATRQFYNNPKVEDRLSFANAKTQIYGNLINLFMYQNILKQ